jgi:hypothetical protein
MNYLRPVFFGSLTQFCNEDNTGICRTSNDPIRLLRYLSNYPKSITEHRREISISNLFDIDNSKALVVEF